MKIFVTGLTTLHWGRMECGNAGNFYVGSPFFRELNRVFPDAELVTTLQFSNRFNEERNIRAVPMESYYAWDEDGADLSNALEEYGIAEIYQSTGSLIKETTYIREVLDSDLVLFFHGDMWGDNADANGNNRFAVDLLKVRTAQLLGRKTVMMASSPGPVTEESTLELAKVAYNSLTASLNREAASKGLMESLGFDVSRTSSHVCPAFLFNHKDYAGNVDVDALYSDGGIPRGDGVKNIGLIPSTYSVSGASFDQWSWDESDFDSFVDLIEHILATKDDNVVLVPHAYGFDQDPDFRRTHWRDYKAICQIVDIVERRGKVDIKRLYRLDSILYPWESHAFLGGLDLLVSGRVHGSVGALGQFVPTMAISYKNGPLAHKMTAFFEILNMERWVVPSEVDDFTEIFDKLYEKQAEVHEELKQIIPAVRSRSQAGFDALKGIVEMPLD